MKITKQAIDEMTWTGGRKDVRSDDEVAGFGVRVWPSGKKTFVYEYRHQGRKRYLTLGKYGALTLVQARALAKDRAAQVAAGGDPQGERLKARQGETVRDLAAVYIARHARPHNKSWERDEERLDRYVLPAWGALKVASITRQDVARLHARIGEKHPTTANRVLSLLGSMWTKARLDFGILPQTHPNPTEGIKRFAEERRRRFVTPEEMPALARAIDQEGNVFVKALLWLYLFTGLRKMELATLTWDNVELWDKPVGFRAGRLHIPVTKSGRPLDLPIPDIAAQILRHLPKLVGNPFVFPGRKDGTHIANVFEGWKRVRTAAGLDDVRIHDLRRTTASWMAADGQSLALIGQVLNHSRVETTAIYARFQLDAPAAALDAVGRKISEAGAKKADAHDLASDAAAATAASAVD